METVRAEAREVPTAIAITEARALMEAVTDVREILRAVMPAAITEAREVPTAAAITEAREAPMETATADREAPTEIVTAEVREDPTEAATAVRETLGAVMPAAREVPTAAVITEAREAPTETVTTEAREALEAAEARIRTEM